MSLSKQISLILTLIAVMSIAIVGYLAYTSSRKAITDQSITHLLATNTLKKAELDKWLQNKSQMLSILANAQFFRNTFASVLERHDPQDPAHVAEEQDIVQSFLQPFCRGGGFLEIFIMGVGRQPTVDEGIVLVSTDPRQKGKIKNSRPYYMQGKKEHFIQNVYYSMPLQQPALTISTPVRAVGGELIAVLAGRVDLSVLSSIMRLQSSRVSSEDTYLVNRHNFFITEPQYGHNYALKKTIHTKGVQRALDQSNGYGFYKDYRGVPVIGAYEWLPGLKLALLTEIDQDEAFAPAYRLRDTILLVALGIALLAIFIGLSISRGITRPLNQLARDAQAMGSGRLDTPIDTSGRAEIGHLARSFDQMRKELKNTLVSRDKLSREVEARTRAEHELLHKNEELERSNRELEQFAYVASHDLQEPLRMVASYTQLLAQKYKDQLDDKAAKYIHYAVDGATRMQTLVNDLLQLSRVGTKGQPFAETDTGQVIHSVRAGLDRLITESGAQIVVGDMPVVMADKGQLALLFQNLIENAIKFRGPEPPEVTISATQRDGEWIFTVQDNGVGINPQYHERVFTIFQRLHERDKYPGTGIGLAIVKKIVERHKGRIWIESEPGQGACFYFTVPDISESRT